MLLSAAAYARCARYSLQALFADKRRSQTKLGLPTIIGEWGAFPSKPFTNDLIRHMNGILEQYLWSSTYWQWMPGIENDPNYSDLSRSYPMVTAGELRAYHYDAEEKALSLCYEARENGVSTLYCPFIPSSLEASAPVSTEIEKISDAACTVQIRVEAGSELTLRVS